MLNNLLLANIKREHLPLIGINEESIIKLRALNRWNAILEHNIPEEEP